ncbi:MAG: hypothetical protein ACYCY3_09675, partial [Halothiobacillus sp.]
AGFKYVTSSPAGYCSSQGRYIPDAEFVRAAKDLFEWKVHHPSTPADGSVYSWTVDSPEYKYYKKMCNSPEGYYVYRYSNTHPILARLFGGYFNDHPFMAGLFEINFVQVVIYVGKSRGEDQIYFYFDDCGRLVWGELAYMYPSYSGQYEGISGLSHPSIASRPCSE